MPEATKPPTPKAPPTEPAVDPAAKKRIDEINAELGKIDGDRPKAHAELAAAVAETPAAKQAAIDQLQARYDALLAERAKLTPPPEPDEAEAAKHAEQLKRSGWTDNGNGTWTNTAPFAHGENVHVGSGVTRSFGDAVTLESQRPR